MSFQCTTMHRALEIPRSFVGPTRRDVTITVQETGPRSDSIRGGSFILLSNSVCGPVAVSSTVISA